MQVIKNPVFLSFVVLYVVSLAFLASTGIYDLTEGLLILFIIGFGLSALAVLSTIGAKPLAVKPRTTHSELITLVACLALVTSYLAWGRGPLDTIFKSVFDDSVSAVRFADVVWKAVLFVAVPLLIFKRWFGYKTADFGLSFNLREMLQARHVLTIIVVGGAILAFQYFVGNAASGFRDGSYTEPLLWMGLLFSFLWLFFEVGLVEEFFFRGLLQGRLAAFFGNEISGLFGAALLFGLAHAPGLYLRSANTAILGEDPSLIGALAYSIAVLSVAGIFFGVIWMRTRSLWVLMAIHAVGDLLPNYGDFREGFGFLWL